jgi:oxygen-independent coproporphyrinogen-3 oxidase
MERALAEWTLERPLDTVFWGGGTPGLLPAADLARLATAVRRLNGERPVREWTVEMAPATVKQDKLDVLADHGVTRISMGVQSFAAAQLEALGRIHSQQQVERAIAMVNADGRMSFNIDLMFAIPGQTLDQWRADLRRAAASGCQHISTYCLTFEDDTALWVKLNRGEVTRFDEDTEAAFHEVAWEELSAAGFVQYEVSNHARAGHDCIHNIHTWQMADWIGVGPSASSQYAGWRWTEPHSIERWLAGLGSGYPRGVDVVELSAGLLAQDALVFGLRMNAGVDIAHLRARFGAAFPGCWDGFAADLVEAGYAVERGSRIRLTDSGRLLADRIGAELLQRCGR